MSFVEGLDSFSVVFIWRNSFGVKENFLRLYHKRLHELGHIAKVSQIGLAVLYQNILNNTFAYRRFYINAAVGAFLYGCEIIAVGL